MSVRKPSAAQSNAHAEPHHSARRSVSAPAARHSLEHERNSAGVGAAVNYPSGGIRGAPTGRLLTDNLAVKARSDPPSLGTDSASNGEIAPKRPPAAKAGRQA